MAATNGVSLPPSTISLDSSSVIGKRKRSSSPEKPLPDHSSNESSSLQSHAKEQFERDVASIVKVIESYDPNKTLLTKPIPSSGSPQRSSKRIRLSDGPETETVAARIQNGTYTSVQTVAEDLRALLDQEASLSPEKSDLDHTDPPLNNISGGNATKFAALRKILDKFASQALLKAERVKVETGDDSTSFPNRLPETESTTKRLVLTLFGSTDRGPKQLFSSLQVSSHDNTEDQPLKIENGSGQKYPRLEENLLPNGISATKVVPFNPQESPIDQKKLPTFGQIFRPHHSIKALEAPKPTEKSSRDSTITWEPVDFDSEFQKIKAAEKGDYKFTELPSGHWLQFTGPKTTSEIENTNRFGFRNRLAEDSERANSLQPNAFDLQVAQDKAAFQKAYSSFAPVYDDSEAIITQKVKSQIWWQKFGSLRFDNLLGSNEALTDAPASASDDQQNEDQVPSREDFSEAVESFIPDEDEIPKGEIQSVSPKDLNEALAQISDLLQDLIAYQRIRLSSLSPLRDPNPEIGDFSTPSSSESLLYGMLKDQLALMVNSLPPYAVAKLDGDQLRALDIGTNIVTSLDEYAGTMEVDDFTLAKQRATASASATASRPTAATQPRAGAYNATTPMNYNRAYAPGVRTPSVGAPYSTRPAYAGATPSQNYGAAGRAMPQTVPRYGAMQQYSGSPSVQQFQRPLPNGYGGSYNSHQQAQNAASAYSQRPSQPGYQQRAQDNAARGPSPQKPMDVLSARNSYPGGSNATQPQYFQQRQPQPGSQNSPSPVPANADGPSQTDGSRIAGPYPSQRPPSATPQPPNGQYHERSLTPGGSQANGTVPPATPVQN